MSKSLHYLFSVRGKDRIEEILSSLTFGINFSNAISRKASGYLLNENTKKLKEANMDTANLKQLISTAFRFFGNFKILRTMILSVSLFVYQQLPDLLRLHNFEQPKKTV